MNNRMRSVVLGMAVVAALLGGCASVPMASLEKDEQAKAFKVKPGTSNIYLYRNESFGGAVKMDVELDGKPMGKTAERTFFQFAVSPGRHTLLSRAENDSQLELITLEGRNYFVWQEVKAGVWFARNKLQLVDEPTGIVGVRECYLIQFPVPAATP